MKKNIFTRIIAIALVAMSIMAVATTALADYGYLNLDPGENDKYRFNISSSTSYYVYFADSVPTGSVVRVQLDYNDWEDLDGNGNPRWKKTASGVLVKGGVNNVVLTPTLFHFVSGRTTQARINCTAQNNNTSEVMVIFHDN